MFMALFNPIKALANGIVGLFLIIDGIIYWAVGLLFDIYYELAGAEIIKNEVYEEIASRFLVIIGVFMLFYLAYSLLRALVNPDELNKNTSKIVINLVTSLILINVVPVIFTYAFQLQNIIIKENVIGNIVFGNTTTNIASVGKNVAMTFFDAFVDVSDSAQISTENHTYESWADLKICIINNKTDGCVGNEGFRDIAILSDSVAAGDTQYTFLVSTLCGAFLAYIILSFCIDLGIRVVKLAFYQIISPIPIFLRIMPEKKSVFDNWVKATLATYLEVFIRILIMYIIAFLCSNILENVNLFGNDELGIISKVIIIMGIFAFAKQAPKLIGNVIGIDAGNIKLGLRQKVADGGGYLAAAALGGGATTMVRNFTHGMSNINSNVQNAKGVRGKFGAAFGTTLRSFGSATGGLISGAVRSGYNARSSKNETEMRNAVKRGVQEAINARDDRLTYKANYPGAFGTVKAHIDDAKVTISNWAGITTPLEQLQILKTQTQEVADARKAVDDRLNKLVDLQANSAYKFKYIGARGEEQTTAYNNLADLRNEIEIMKSTGKTSKGEQVTASMLTSFNDAEFKLKQQLKQEILKGYKKDGARMSAAEFESDYDGLLKQTVTALRTKSNQRANIILDNSTDNANNIIFKEQAINHQKDSLNDFVLNGNANDLFDASLKSVNSASANVNIQLNERIQKEAANNNKK